MKSVLLAIALLSSTSGVCFAGSHGVFELKCTSDSFRTQMYFRLNDTTFLDTPLQPQRIVLSVVGHMYLFDELTDYGFNFVTEQQDNLLYIHSDDPEQSFAFLVNFSQETTARVVIRHAINPRTDKAFSGLSLECVKVHDV